MGLDPGRGGTGPGGLSGTFLGLLSAAEKDEGFLLSASPAFLISEGLRGKDDGLSSDGRFGNFSPVLLVAGLGRTLDSLPEAGLLTAPERDEGLLLSASPTFFMSEGLRGRDDGLSSDGRFGNLSSVLVAGLERTFVCLPGAGLLSAAEKDEGFLLPDASPAFLMSEGLRGKEDGLSSNGCFVTFAPLPVVGGLGETFG